jgi:hypothetical protein
VAVADCGIPTVFKRRHRQAPNQWRCGSEADMAAYYLGEWSARFTRSGDIRVDASIFFMAIDSNAVRFWPINLN